ncbi:MAG: hypothetical protein WD278_17735 [Pirellulales bacterium]
MRRFLIRDLLWLTLIVALALGWWVDHRQLASDLQAARQELAQSRWKADLWETMAIAFAKQMRAAGWYVRVAADGSGYGWTTPDSFVGDPEGARKLNDAHPLPSE